MKRPLPDISDQKLVVLLKRDDLKSYEVLFHRYYDLFLTFTKRVVREHVAAEDIVQEVFMQLWLGRDRLDEHRSLYNLLFTMTKHRIYDHFRRRYNLEALRRPLSEFDAVSDEAESPESGLEAEQLRQTIARTVAAMPPQRRTIFALSRQENLSRQEIARRLGSVGTHGRQAPRTGAARNQAPYQGFPVGAPAVPVPLKSVKEDVSANRMQNRIRPDDAANFSSPRSAASDSRQKRGDHRSPRPLKQTFRHFPKTSFSTAANR